MRKNLENEELRTIPITNGFMMKKVNDIFYGYLQCKSYIDKDMRRFCYASSINYSDLAKKFGGAFSKSKLHRDMKLFIELGFVQEGTVLDLYGEETKAFLLPFDTQKNIYKFIPLETMRFMVDNLSPHSIKVYSYLLNKFQGHGSRYTFTKKELINMLGVKNPKGRDYELINQLLEELLNAGLIEYVAFYVSYDKGVTPKHRLLKVNEYHTATLDEELVSDKDKSSSYEEDAESIFGTPRISNINHTRHEETEGNEITFGDWIA